MGVKGRIVEYIKYKGMSQGKFEKQCGLANGYVNNIRQSITPEKLQKIALCYPDLNIAWLIAGEGSMVRDAEVKTCLRARRGVPFIDVDFLKLKQNVELKEFDPAFLVDFMPYNTVDFWTNISGHGMEPVISSGDIIAIKQIKDWQNFILFGEIYAIITDEFRTVKIITKADSNDKLRLVPISKDANYCVQDIPVNKIVQIYALYGVMKKLM